MGPLEDLLRGPHAIKAITDIKRQMTRRWSRYFSALEAFTLKDPEQIVDDVVIDVWRGVIIWNHGNLEAVLAYWSHRRILGELKNAGLRRRLSQQKGCGLPSDKLFKDDTNPDLDKAEGLWTGLLPSHQDVVIRTTVMQLCKGHELETQLAEMVLEDPGLIVDKSFKAQDIREEFESRGVRLQIREVHALIERFRKLMKAFG